MNGLSAFLIKELRETTRTWRLWVLPGFLLFSALGGPLLTYFLPALIDALGSQSGGLSLAAPEPTAAMAYAEYLGNLGELVVLALVIAYGGIVSAEVRSGTAALTLAKPLSRHAFVLAKWLAQLALLIVATLIATAVCLGITAALIGVGPVAALAAATGLWLAFAVMLLSLMILLSVLLRAPAAPSGVGVGVYIALAILGQFGLVAEYSPAGLTSAGAALLMGRPAVWPVPLLTALAASVVLLLAALWAFSRKEI
jgi:ABC-2 type transport system permease protein